MVHTFLDLTMLAIIIFRLRSIASWMQGNVSVTSDISSVTLANRKNNVKVQLPWTPLPKAGEITHFKIIFIDKKLTTIKNTLTIYFQSTLDRIRHCITRRFIHPVELNLPLTSLAMAESLIIS
jgi:hypothetical protein